MQAKPSDPGRIAEQVLASVGGLWGTGLLAEKETLTLLDKMAKSVRRYDSGTIEEYPDRTVGVKEWTDLISKRSSGPFAHRRAANLDRFIEANVLKLGLEVTCTNCLKRNWYGIDNLGTQLICERCL